METPKLHWTELSTRLSCLCYDIEDLEQKMKFFKSRIAKRIMQIRLDAMRIEWKELAKQYDAGDYIDDYDPDAPLYDEEMCRANEAIEACYDI